MKGFVAILAVLAVLVVMIAGAGLFLSTKTSLFAPEEVNLDKGWTNFTVPSSWHDTTAKALLEKYANLTAITMTKSDGTLTGYLRSYPDAYNFAVTPGMKIWVWTSVAMTIDG